MASEVDLIVNAKGRIVTPLPNIVVQPLETSIVQSIDVRAGQVVRKEASCRTPIRLCTGRYIATTKASSIASIPSGPVWTRSPYPVNGWSVVKTRRTAKSSRACHKNGRPLLCLTGAKAAKESIGRLRSSLETARKDEEGQLARVKGLRKMEAMTDDLVNKKLAVRSRLLEVRDRLLEAERTLETSRNQQVELRKELAALEGGKRQPMKQGWRQKLLEEMLVVSRERDTVE